MRLKSLVLRDSCLSLRLYIYLKLCAIDWQIVEFVLECLVCGEKWSVNAIYQLKVNKYFRTKRTNDEKINLKCSLKNSRKKTGISTEWVNKTKRFVCWQLCFIFQLLKVRHFHLIWNLLCFFLCWHFPSIRMRNGVWLCECVFRNYFLSKLHKVVSIFWARIRKQMFVVEKKSKITLVTLIGSTSKARNLIQMWNMQNVWAMSGRKSVFDGMISE